MRSKLNDLYHHFLLWLNKHIKERTLLLFVCFLVGIATALASYMVKTSILYPNISHREFYPNRCQLFLFAVSSHRITPMRTVCKIYCQRRYQPRGHESIICHFATQKPHKTPQHVHLYHRQLYYHRFWRIGRC
jgi:hypothetical protein